MALTSILELGVSEAYAILENQLGVRDLPPLDAVENEDWGRDLVLSRFLDLSSEQLAELGLYWPEPAYRSSFD
jgi:hypothetical protein